MELCCFRYFLFKSHSLRSLGSLIISSTQELNVQMLRAWNLQGEMQELRGEGRRLDHQLPIEHLLYAFNCASIR